jgi:ABC-2 type transport system permease protein
MTSRIITANLIVRLKTLSREKSAMFFTIAFPVILVLVFGTIFTKPEKMNFDLAVQDLDQSDASQALVSMLSIDDLFNTIAVSADADPAQFAREYRQNLVLVIPRGFGEMQSRRLLYGDENASVVLSYIHDPSSTSVDTKLHYLNTIVVETNQRMSGTQPFITAVGQSILDRQYRFIEFFVPGIIAMAVMTSCLSGALNMNAELRQKGILRKLTTTPITPADWLMSNMLYQLVLAAASTIAILIVSYLVFDVRLQLNGWLPAFIVLSVFVFVGMGLLLTPIAREAESAVAAANAILFPMMFLSGTFFPVDMMPGFLQSFARVLPLFYINEGLRASMIFSDGAEALRCAAITGGVAVVLFVAGAIVTRWGKES